MNRELIFPIISVLLTSCIQVQPVVSPTQVEKIVYVEVTPKQTNTEVPTKTPEPTPTITITPTPTEIVFETMQDAFRYNYELYIKQASKEEYDILHKVTENLIAQEEGDSAVFLIKPYPVGYDEFLFVMDNVSLMACYMSYYRRTDGPLRDVYVYAYNLEGNLLRARYTGDIVKKVADSEVYATSKAVISYGCKHQICGMLPGKITPDPLRIEAITEATRQAKSGYYKGN